MPYKKSISKSGPLTGSSETHLLVGRCLLSNCGICSGGAGMSRPLGLEAYTLNLDAKETWERHRERLLAIWREPAGRPAKASGFNVSGLQGCGRLGLPTWAEMVFEGAKMPKLSKAWPLDVREAWAELNRYF
jgi:hypothetical protein